MRVGGSGGSDAMNSGIVWIMRAVMRTSNAPLVTMASSSSIMFSAIASFISAEFVTPKNTIFLIALAGAVAPIEQPGNIAAFRRRQRRECHVIENTLQILRERRFAIVRPVMRLGHFLQMSGECRRCFLGDRRVARTFLSGSRNRQKGQQQQ